jgi:hypothetical protein
MEEGNRSFETKSLQRDKNAQKRNKIKQKNKKKFLQQTLVFHFLLLFLRKLFWQICPIVLLFVT